MKNVVITGSTRGIGYGLADAFLARGCAVTVSGRSQSAVDAAVQQLSGKHGKDRLQGCPYDVTQLAQVEALWAAARDCFGEVDVWINNAGIGHPMSPMWELEAEQVRAVVDTNVTGVLNGARVAVRGMLSQGRGQIYIMQGFGAKGQVRAGLSVYGASKAAVNYLTQSLILETRDTPVQVGSLSPGMVVTDLLLDPLRADPEALERSRRVFDILTDRVETVAPWMADQVLANNRTDAHIKWLTTPRIIWRFLSAPFNKRDVFSDKMA